MKKRTIRRVMGDFGCHYSIVTQPGCEVVHSRWRSTVRRCTLAGKKTNYSEKGLALQYCALYSINTVRYTVRGRQEIGWTIWTCKSPSYFLPVPKEYYARETG